jgi:hypothetical protein
MVTLDELFGTVREFIKSQDSFNEKHSEKTEKILVQVTKTNGRVTELESFKEKIESINNEQNVTKGKNAVILQVLKAAGAIALLGLGYLISKL